MVSSFQKLSEGARRVISLAGEEAQRLNHNYIGTEHILLGLVRETEGGATRVLSRLGVDLSKVQSAVEFIIGRGEKPTQGASELTSRAKKVVELAVDEACRMNHTHIDTEHLLIGLLRENDGVAADVLESLGVTLEKCRAELSRVLVEHPSAEEAQAQPGQHVITQEKPLTPGEKIHLFGEELHSLESEKRRVEERIAWLKKELENLLGEMDKISAQERETLKKLTEMIESYRIWLSASSESKTE